MAGGLFQRGHRGVEVVGDDAEVPYLAAQALQQRMAPEVLQRAVEPCFTTTPQGQGPDEPQGEAVAKVNWQCKFGAAFAAASKLGLKGDDAVLPAGLILEERDNVIVADSSVFPTSTGYGLGLPIATAGLLMLPAALTMAVVAPGSATISRQFGARTTLVIGSLFILLGFLLRSWLMASAWQVVLGAVVVGIGGALAYAAMPLIIMGAVPVSETAAANGINSVMRNIGTATASAIPRERAPWATAIWSTSRIARASSAVTERPDRHRSSAAPRPAPRPRT